MQTTTPAFLNEQAIAQNGAEAGLDDAAHQTLHEFARRISEDPQLRLIASAAHHALYETDADFAEALRVADTAFGAEAGILHALLVLDSLRLVRERQAARGVQPAIATAVNRRHGGGWLHDAAVRGDLGSVLWIPDWLRIVASGDLYRLGRLEFLPRPLVFPLRVYTHVRTGEVIALAEAGVPFSDEGLVLGTPTWASNLVETEDAVVGTAIHPRGIAVRQPVRLPRDEWQLLLKPGDPILDIHVPGDEPLTIAALRDAHMQATTFFDQYYPDRRFIAFLCDSWLFSPLLEAMLGPDSNIVRWQREGYLLPGDSEGEDLLGFTFGSRHIDTAVAPRDTRLRRAVIAHLEQGKMLSCGLYLFLRQDLDRFGSQPYREVSAHAIEQLTVP